MMGEPLGHRSFEIEIKELKTKIDFINFIILLFHNLF